LAIFIGLPKSINIKKISDDMVVVLDSVQITDITNLKFKDTNAGSTKSETKKFTTITQHNTDVNLNSVEPPTEIVAETKIIEEQAPKIIKKPKSKPQTGVLTKKNIVSKSLHEDDELASLLQSLDDKTTSGSIQSSGEKSGIIGKGKSDYNDKKAMGISTINSIRSQFMRCWNVPIGAMDIQDLVIIIDVELDDSGNVIFAKIQNKDKYNKNPFAKALAESALRAVYTCSPIKNLPKSSFKNWQNMQLTFNAKDML
jgi:hypothetical protein